VAKRRGEAMTRKENSLEEWEEIYKERPEVFKVLHQTLIAHSKEKGLKTNDLLLALQYLLVDTGDNLMICFDNGEPLFKAVTTEELESIKMSMN
jgi:hypothetical protein